MLKKIFLKLFFFIKGEEEGVFYMEKKSSQMI